MEKGTILVTETNTKGIITKVNEAFVNISGYSESELMGKNHNIVRHPDMPPEAFADLWKTVKKGNPWVGVVKNRCKNGDYYWVEANVTPIYKNGRLDTFVSSRYSPSREQVREAEALYDKIKKKEASLEKTGLLHKLNFVKKLSFGQKMAGIGLSLLLPAFLLMGMFFHAENQDIQFAETEIKGSEYLVPLKQFASHVAEHRGLSNVYLGSGNSTDTSAISQATSRVVADIEAFNKMDERNSEVLGTTQSWQTLKQKWKQLEEQNLKLTAEQSFTQHSALINDVLSLFVAVGDSSNLIRDPDLDSFYLMDLQVIRLPELMEQLGKLRGFSARLAGTNSLSQKQLIKLVVLEEKVNGLLSATLHDIEMAIAENDSLESVFTDKKANLSRGINTFLATMHQLKPAPDAVSSQQLFNQGSEAITAVSTLYDVTAPNLKTLLENRVEGFKQELTISLVSIALLIGLVSFLGYRLIRYFKNNMDAITNVFHKLTDGEFRNKLDLSSQDELGDVSRALQAMQVRMNVDMAEIKEQAISGQRIQQALDTVESCVMVANNNLEIIYMNETVKDMFKNAEAEIQQQLPMFKADELLGTNIDVFHENPAHQRGMLEKLDATFRSTLMIGGRHLDIVANPVNTDDGEKVGIVVEWRDRTHEVKIEQEIATIVNSVKAGQLSSRIETAAKEGFFETLSEGINELTEVIDHVFSDISQTMQGMSRGDLSNRINGDYQGVYLECKNSINGSMDKIAEIVGQVNESAEFINNSSQEIASGNNNLSNRAEQQAANLEQTASSMEELTSTVKNNADNAQQANQVATSARQLAEKGGDIVTSAVAAMEEINESSTKIAEIIGVIDEIAFQTNLLALNASVEAARAGEQGRGFSVVATEVRNLAQRSATAARESKELIQTSVRKVRSGTEFVNETGKSLSEIVTGVKKVGDIVAEIAAASAEQSQGIEQVNQAVSQMDEITQQNAALAEQASAASVSMTEQSASMSQLLGFFNTKGGGSNSYQPSQSSTSSLDFTLAKSKHLAWKGKLRNFLDGSEALTMDQAVSHRDCDLGKWLYSSGLAEHGHLPAMQTLEKFHAEMHGNVKDCINHKNHNDSQAASQDYNAVSSLSDKIVGLLGEIESSISGGGQAMANPAAARPVPVATYTPAAPAPQSQSLPSFTSGDSGSGSEWEEF
jgi:methyl-accepting chemotaxis protein